MDQVKLAHIRHHLLRAFEQTVRPYAPDPDNGPLLTCVDELLEGKTSMEFDGEDFIFTTHPQPKQN